MSLTVFIANDNDRDSWEQFRGALGLKHHAHQWMWRKVFQRSFGQQPYYLIAREDNRDIVGILPLFLVKSVLFGRALISVPYLNGGGVAAKSDEGYRKLVECTESLGSELGARYIELRERQQVSVSSVNWCERSHKVSMLLKLSADPQPVFESFPAKLRSQIRRPAKDGLHAESSREVSELPRLLDAFYLVFSKNMRDLGTPVYPKRLFEEIAQNAIGALRIIVVWDGIEPAAAGITITEGDTAEIPWASALRKFNRSSPNMLLYWEAVKAACLDNATTFDFGRCTPDSGSYRFKEQWGAVPLPLYWYYRMFQGEVPDVNPKSSKFSALVECWKRLPLPVANTVGPWLTRSLP